jgi:uncharacterized protein (TIGR03435 family)
MRVVLFLALACLAAPAQTGSAPRLEFEVASIKALGKWDGVTPRRDGGPGTSDPGRIRYINWSLRMLTAKAYGTKGPFQLSTPGWMADEFYALEAKLPPNASDADLSLMLQSLLAERFHLEAHRESKSMPAYVLLEAKGGVKLKPSAALPPGVEAFSGNSLPQDLHVDADGRVNLPPGYAGSIITARHGLQHMTARRQGIEAIRDFLEGALQKPVLDQTGLTGIYDFELEYARPNRPTNAAQAAHPNGKTGADSLDDPGLPLPAAIQSQLGLRLESKTVPISVLVVDRADKTPTEN